MPFLASRRAGFPVSLSLRALAVIWLCLPGPARQRQRQHPPARAPAWAHHRSRSVTAAGPACRPALPCPAQPRPWGFGFGMPAVHAPRPACLRPRLLRLANRCRVRRQWCAVRRFRSVSLHVGSSCRVVGWDRQAAGISIGHNAARRPVTTSAVRSATILARLHGLDCTTLMSHWARWVKHTCVTLPGWLPNASFCVCVGRGMGAET